MIDLEGDVREGAAKLQQAWTFLQSGAKSSLPRKCFEQWSRRSALHSILTGTAAIFPARAVAWELIRSVLAAENLVGDPENNKVRYGNVDMDFSVARHLLLTSYISVTWSAYDRLANVCGRLAGIADLADNPRQNPRLCEDIAADRDKKKDTLGFALHLQIREAYLWPLKVSYKIRNWLVHEGYEEGGTPLFRSGRVADEFILHDDAIQYLQRCCDYRVDNGKIEASCVAASDECWSHKNLLRILEQYHGEIDIMFSALLKWSVDSFVGQIRAFASRDQA